ELLLNPEDLSRSLHLGPTYLGDVLADLGAFHGGVEDVTTLATGHGDDHDVDTFVHVARHRGRAPARLVVWMGVDGHKPWWFGRRRILPESVNGSFADASNCRAEQHSPGTAHVRAA